MARSDDIQWRKAQDWLCSTGKFTTRHSNILDFALNLKDGVVLCEIAHFLQAGSIKSFNPRPTIHFICVKNIDAFLTACIKYFGFEAHELFTATELLESENFNKVVELLSKLSYTAQAKNIGLRPFSCHYGDQEIYTTLHREAESYQEEIYSRIEDYSRFDHYSDGYQDTNESVYDDISKIKQYRLETPHDKRGYMIDEIFETEKNYVQHLEIIILYYKRKLEPILSMDDTKTIFHDIESLKETHEKLLQRLKQSIDKGGETIGQCFVKTETQFYQYAPYCANLDKSSRRLDELACDSKIQSHLTRCALESKQRFSLKDLLRVPSQRILKYHLLLDNLLKDSPNNTVLQEGSKTMKALANYINEYKRNFEAKSAIMAIEERIQNTDLDSGNLYSFGRLLKDGEIQLRVNNKNLKRFAFLFEQCLLICKMKEQSNLDVQVSLDFETYEFSEKIEPPGGTKFSFGWVIRPRDKPLISDLATYQVMVKTADQLHAWSSRIDDGLSVLEPPAHHRFPHELLLHTFGKITKCGVCDELISGVFAQGIMCRVCLIPCHRQCKPRLTECANVRSSSSRGAFHKDLPSLPSTPISSPHNMSDPLPHSYQTNGSPVVSPPPIPPRAPSVKGRRSVPNALTPQLSTGGLDHSRSGSLDQGSVSPQLVVQGDLYVCTRDFNGTYIGDAFEPTIPLTSGEFVEVTKRDHPMYWRGKSQSSGHVGYFPSENVKIFSPRHDVASSPAMMHPFQGQTDNGRKLFNYPWYVGEMDRAGGRMMLEPVYVPDGCYLVRESQNRIGQFSIDVKFNFMVKHIKVVYSEDAQTFCLAPSKTFPTIVDLVMHYQRNTLGQVFRDLQTCLSVPYRCLPGS